MGLVAITHEVAGRTPRLVNPAGRPRKKHQIRAKRSLLLEVRWYHPNKGSDNQNK